MQTGTSTLLSSCKRSNESHHAAFKASFTIKERNLAVVHWNTDACIHRRVRCSCLPSDSFSLSSFCFPASTTLPPSRAATVFRPTTHFAGSGLWSSTLVSSLRWRTCSRRLISSWLQIMQQTGLHRSDSKQHYGSFLHVSKIRYSKCLQIFRTSAKTS
jgi:hypothetical protein